MVGCVKVECQDGQIVIEKFLIFFVSDSSDSPPLGFDLHFTYPSLLYIS